jgi:hypothetical protein
VAASRRRGYVVDVGFSSVCSGASSGAARPTIGTSGVGFAHVLETWSDVATGLPVITEEPTSRSRLRIGSMADFQSTS